MVRLPYYVLVIVILAVVAASSDLQILQHVHRGTAGLGLSDRLFGWHRGALGDVNGDGITEYAYGSRFANKVYIASLNSRLKIREVKTITTSTGARNFGAPASAGDIDGDGVPDMFTGGSEAYSFWITLLKADMTVKSQKRYGYSNTRFSDYCGHYNGNAGDVDGNGVQDAIYGCMQFFYIVLVNSDGTRKGDYKLTASSLGLGSSFHRDCTTIGLGDQCGDGKMWLAVPDQSTIYVFRLTSTGAPDIDTLARVSKPSECT